MVVPEKQNDEKLIVKAIQRLAFEQLLSIDFWYRRQYNLTTTDKRYLDATPEEMAVDFWSFIFLERYRKLKKDGAEEITLDDLTAEESFEDQLEALDRQLEAEAAEKAIGEGTAAAADEEVLINFKAPEPALK